MISATLYDSRMFYSNPSSARPAKSGGGATQQTAEGAERDGRLIICLAAVATFNTRQNGRLLVTLLVSSMCGSFTVEGSLRKAQDEARRFNPLAGVA